MKIVEQALSVSALIAVTESLIEDGRLTNEEAATVSNIIGLIREAFTPRLPTLIICDPEFDATLDRVGVAMGAAE